MHGCPDNYVEETAKRVSKRVLDNTGKDINSLLYEHSIATGHKTLKIRHF